MSNARRVIVGGSGSPGSLQVLRYAQHLARALDATLVPVLAWLPPGDDLADRRTPCQELRHQWAQDAREQLQDALNLAGETARLSRCDVSELVNRRRAMRKVIDQAALRVPAPNANTAGEPAITRADAVRGAVGLWDRFCSALGHPGASGGGSVAVITLASGVVPVRLRSRVLNEILAFDMAEFLGHLRQVNTIVVSSFAGPECTIWGYDAARHEALDSQAAVLTVERHDGKMIPVKPLQPLLEAGDALLEAYPLPAGTVTPCALRTITAPGPCVVSAALGVGIAEHRSHDADLFMEDARVQRRRWRPAEMRRHPGRSDRGHHEWVEDIAASIVAVGGQQGVLYQEIFAGVTSAQVPAWSFGGAVAGIPYCLLPRAAVPDDPAALLDPVTWPQAQWRATLAPAGQPA